MNLDKAIACKRLYQKFLKWLPYMAAKRIKMARYEPKTRLKGAEGTIAKPKTSSSTPEWVAWLKTVKRFNTQVVAPLDNTWAALGKEEQDWITG